jgi:hypothetical protein
MTTTELTQAKEASLEHDVLSAARYYLGGRRGLVVLTAAVIVAGLAFNWSWLAAAGIAPVLLSLLPCVAMCALGLCMNRMTGRSCAADGASRVKHATADEPSHGSPRHSRDADVPTLEQ